MFFPRGRLVLFVSLSLSRHRFRYFARTGSKIADEVSFSSINPLGKRDAFGSQFALTSKATIQFED